MAAAGSPARTAPTPDPAATRAAAGRATIGPVSQVPAATRALRVLRFLATQADPVPLDLIMRACDLPRSTAYHLLNTMIDEGFVVHLPDEHRYGLGVAAFEVGSGFTRQEPLARLARRPQIRQEPPQHRECRLGRCRLLCRLVRHVRR